MPPDLLRRTLALEDWARATPAARLDPRAKLGAAALILAAIALAPLPNAAAVLRLALLAPAAACAGALALRVPPGGVLLRAAAVLPFSAGFALLSWLAGDPLRAASLAVKSYSSALFVLLVMASTPLDRLLAGCERAGLPPLLVQVMHFVYRYFFVAAEQAGRMRLAAQARGAARDRRAAAGMLAVLFARSYARAEGIHRAMLARGFAGSFPQLEPLPCGAAGWSVVAAGLCLAALFYAAGAAR